MGVRQNEGTPFERLYLDVCALCRPFDDQRTLRVRLETDAYYLILNAVQSGRYRMIVSPAHIAEIRGIPNSRERLELLALLKNVGQTPSWDLADLRRRAEELFARSFGAADAAHVAFAEASADFFVSCDDKLVKKCNRKRVGVPALNPAEFCMRKDLR